jgi:hypothetical protein
MVKVFLGAFYHSPPESRGFGRAVGLKACKSRASIEEIVL